ncbi:UNVERIFIED_CONTAM: hypothetical protein GTU68_024253 [Idotea baltica]|nr:hypothetical protein [Idotea baltica]
MTTIRIEDLKNYEAQTVKLQGWVANKRTGKGLVFIVLRDGSGFTQCVVTEAEVKAEHFEDAKKLGLESSVELCGKVVKDDRQMGGYELQVTDVQVIQFSEDYPIAKKEHGIEFLMDNRHLWLRSKRQWAIMRIRSRAKYAIHTFFQERGFIQTDAPIFTGNACEGTTTLFETDFYGETAYLSQSGQLYAEATAMALGKVYTFGPTFRAEKSKTRRHLSEFWMIEPEMAFYNLEMNMDLIEEFLKYVVNDILKTHRAELDILERDLSLFENIDETFPRITYTDAVKILRGELEVNGKTSIQILEDGEDFGGSDETVLTRMYNAPIMVFNWPKAIKAFYMKRDEENPEFVKGVDVLAPEGFGEIVGGAERESDHDLLLQRIKDHDLPQEAFDWYLDLRKYGSVPHAGFGLGFERLVMWLTNSSHIRETIPMPRYYGKLNP